MQTISETMNSVTGFDEIAVEKHFGFDLYKMAESKPLMTTRAAVFVSMRHEGVPDKEAYQSAMEMPVSKLQDYFAPEEDEVFADDPDTESGKDSLQLESALQG